MKVTVIITIQKNVRAVFNYELDVRTLATHSTKVLNEIKCINCDPDHYADHSTCPEVQQIRK